MSEREGLFGGGSSLEDGPEGDWKWGMAALGGRRRDVLLP